MDGTYMVTYTPASAGEYRVSVEFLGTFQVLYLLPDPLVYFNLGIDRYLCYWCSHKGPIRRDVCQAFDM